MFVNLQTKTLFSANTIHELLQFVLQIFTFLSYRRKRLNCFYFLVKVNPRLDWCQFFQVKFQGSPFVQLILVEQQLQSEYTQQQKTSKGNIQVCLNILFQWWCFLFMCIAPLEVSNIHYLIDFSCTSFWYSLRSTNSHNFFYGSIFFRDFCNESIETLV